MLDLSEHYGEGPVQSREIADRRDVPEPYLNQLLGQLRKSGLIISRRGPGGGHMLGRPASEITVADMVSALEGPIWPENDETRPTDWAGQPDVLVEVWLELAEVARRFLSGVTLAEVLDRERRRALTYQI